MYKRQDMDLPVGNLRIRSAGGTGGHRGMTSLVENLGTREFARIRIGIGRPPVSYTHLGRLPTYLK